MCDVYVIVVLITFVAFSVFIPFSLYPINDFVTSPFVKLQSNSQLFLTTINADDVEDRNGDKLVRRLMKVHRVLKEQNKELQQLQRQLTKAGIVG